MRLQADGWYASRAVQIALHALAYLANPADRHAALYLAVTELGSLTLQEALTQLMESGRIDGAAAREARSARRGGGGADRVHAGGGGDRGTRAVRYRDAAGRTASSNARTCCRLQAEAAEFMDANREALAYGGFHGSGVQTFLAWLEARVELKDGDRQPEPRVLDEDAIVLTTWHSAKGREWPVVAVCGLDKEVEGQAAGPGARLHVVRRSVETAGAGADRVRAEVRGAGDRRPVPRRARCARRDRGTALLYVALTRARDKLVLEWPEYLAGEQGHVVLVDTPGAWGRWRWSRTNSSVGECEVRVPGDAGLERTAGGSRAWHGAGRVRAAGGRAARGRAGKGAGRV